MRLSFSSFQVIAGAHDIYLKTPPVQLRPITAISFNPTVDVAIIRMNPPLTLNPWVQPINLAANGFQPPGRISSNLLKVYFQQEFLVHMSLCVFWSALPCIQLLNTFVINIFCQRELYLIGESTLIEGSTLRAKRHILGAVFVESNLGKGTLIF